MNNPFHSQGPEFDKDSQLKDDSQLKEYIQQLDKEYGNSIPARMWKAILLSIKKNKLDNSAEQNRKIYWKA